MFKRSPNTRHNRRSNPAGIPAHRIPAVAAILTGPADLSLADWPTEPIPAVGPLPTVPLFLPGLLPALTAGATR